MKAWYSIPILGIFIFSLTGCPNKKTPSRIAEQLKRGVVLISYKNRGGHGTGFFVTEDPSNCAVLTAGHVVSTYTPEQLILTTSDNQTREVTRIRPFPNLDLALLTFAPRDNSYCPYQALELGDSDMVDTTDQLYILGFDNNGIKQKVKGGVTTIYDLPNGYRIAYQATTTAGMSGSPVANLAGQVVAVHGRTDIEINILATTNNFDKPQNLQSVLPSEQLRNPDSIRPTFAWGIPIKKYLDIVGKKPQQNPTTTILAKLVIILFILIMVCGLCITVIHVLVHEN